MTPETRTRRFTKFEVTCRLPMTTRDMSDMLFLMRQHNKADWDNTFDVASDGEEIVAGCTGCEQCREESE